MSRVSSIEAARLQQQRRAQGKNARIVQIPAPIGGWNARDSIADMSPTDAVSLTNWFPTTSDVMVRLGFTKFATGLPGQVETLMPYNPASGAQKLFAASGTAIYDVSAGGTVGAGVVTGLTNDRWSYVNFATPAGPFLCAVNGADGYYVYNGTTWQSVTSGSSPISITGVTPSTLNFVTAFAQRLWFIQAGSLNAYYLPTSSVGGAAAVFPMQPIFRRGGYLVSIGVWTVDGGYGMQDYMAFVTSEGEIAIYGGTDPTQASNFYLVGVYQLGSPMGNRCFLKYGSDLLYIGKDGLGPLSRLMASTRVNTAVELTAKIQGAISSATAIYGSNFGWSMVLYPAQNMLLLNVPISVGQQQQYVMNTITGAWCNFTGWPANCWERWEDSIYFGGNGYVGLAWNTYADNAQNISAVAQQAYGDFGTANQKRFTMMRPILTSNGSPAIAANIDVDYSQSLPLATLAYSPSTYGTWDSAIWDTAIWGGGLSILKNWEGVTGLGMTGSPILNAATNGIETHWAATDIVFEIGQNVI